MEDLKNYEMASRRVDLRDDLASLQAELRGAGADRSGRRSARGHFGEAKEGGGGG